MKRSVRTEIGKKRIVSILRTYTVACDRTLEQKISDAGPNPMRVEPSIITEARQSLVREGSLLSERRGKAPWFYLTGTPQQALSARMDILVPLHPKTQDGLFTHRLGQTLEIAVFKALRRSGLNFLGYFSDLGEHDDSIPFTKVDPPLVISGRKVDKGPLDYLVFPGGDSAGIEVKNYRTWLYPRSPAVRELLWKCSDIDAIPVLIARRLPFITIRLLQLGGCLVHENYNQLYPVADSALAAEVRNKNLLGYHDVRTGNEPDARLLRFVGQLLPQLVASARPRFAALRDAHHAYGSGVITYAEWIKRIRAVTGPWRRAVRDEARSEGGNR